MLSGLETTIITVLHTGGVVLERGGQGPNKTSLSCIMGGVGSNVFRAQSVNRARVGTGWPLL